MRFSSNFHVTGHLAAFQLQTSRRAHLHLNIWSRVIWLNNTSIFGRCSFTFLDVSRTNIFVFSVVWTSLYVEDDDQAVMQFSV